jgi:3-oxoacyl-[acyl-carrier protein] reductase
MRDMDPQLQAQALLAGEVAVVTGASRGIGRAVALELARAGAAVVVAYRSSRAAAEATAAAITAAGGTAEVFAANVVEESEVQALIDFAVRQLGRLDVLVTSAGVVRDQLAAAMSLDEWDVVLDTNLRGTFLPIRAAVRPMMAQKKGAIVALSSIAALRGSRGHCNYAAAKGGINALVLSLAVELAPKRIRVNAVAPGVIATDMTKRIIDFASDEILPQIPLRRFGEPQEVARAVRFLASSDASYITGEILRVTGGLGV